MRHRFFVLTCVLQLFSSSLTHAQTLGDDIGLSDADGSAQQGKHYLVHSNGNVLGCNTNNVAVLVAPRNAKALNFTKQTDGTFLIDIDGKYLSLGTQDTWTTYFDANALAPNASYTIEQDGEYVKLKNVKTKAYLGTDDTGVGAWVFSDKSGSDMKHLWKISDTPTIEIAPDTLSYPVGILSPRQTIEGWGLSLCWWANMCGKWSDTKINQLVTWLVSPTGLNMNVFRYNIGGGDDPQWTNCEEHHMANGKGLRAEMEGFQDSRGGKYHWERDAAQRKIMLKIKEKRPDAIFEAFSNSCPWWMTNSGCCSGNSISGNDNLNPDYYTDFAHYLVDVCKHYKEEYGIEFRTLEPFNESRTDYWVRSGTQEGCHFDYSSQVAFLRVLQPILQQSGLNTKISAADETNTYQAVEGLKEYNRSGVANFIAQCNTHTYSADAHSRSQFGSLARSMGKRVWMSETGQNGNGIGGNLTIAQRLIDDVRYIAPSAWVDWQYMEEWNDQWCFVTGNFNDATYSKNKNYSVRQQVTRFIKQGYSIVPSLNEQSLAAVNPARDSLVLVLLNPRSSQVHDVSIPMAKIRGTVRAWRTSESESLASKKCFSQLNDSILRVDLAQQSITTIVIPITLTAEPANELSDEDVYMIIPQSNASMAVCGTNAGLSLSPENPNDPSQQWHFSLLSDGSYTLTNGLGRMVTFSSDYFLTSPVASGTVRKSQKFLIQDADGIHYKIMLKGDSQKRSWDLQNTSLSQGTRIGAYPYDNVDGDHRHWTFVKIASAVKNTPDAIESLPQQSVKNSNESEIFYNLAGVKLQHATKGINIVRCPNGKVIKRVNIR